MQIVDLRANSKNSYKLMVETKQIHKKIRSLSKSMQEDRKKEQRVLYIENKSKMTDLNPVMLIVKWKWTKHY